MDNPAWVAAILDSVATSLGLPCTPGERHLLQVLAEEPLRTRKAQLDLAWRIIDPVTQDPQSRLVGAAFGRVTALVLETAPGSPLDYPDARAYLKAMGLNLKERSSGQHKGKLKITKRGPGRAHHYLFLSNPTPRGPGVPEETTMRQRSIAALKRLAARSLKGVTRSRL